MELFRAIEEPLVFAIVLAAAASLIRKLAGTFGGRPKAAPKVVLGARLQGGLAKARRRTGC